MIFFALLVLAQTELTPDISTAADSFRTCVTLQSARLSAANESADVTIDAAMTACVTELARFRVITLASVKRDNPRMSDDSAEAVEAKTFQFAKDMFRSRAILELLEFRVQNAQNK